METKKIICCAVILAVLMLVLTLVPEPRTEEGLYPRDTHILDLRGQPLPEMRELIRLRKLRLLDLRDTGLTLRQHRELTWGLPNCDIIWSVPLRDGNVDSDSLKVTLTELTAGDLDLLKFLNALETLEIQRTVPAEDVSMLLRWMKSRPEVSVTYRLSLNGGEYPMDTRELVLEDAEPETVETALAAMDQLERLSFKGTQPKARWVSRWMRRYPQTVFVWDFQVCGVPVNSLDTELILNGIPVARVDAVESMLPYFYNLQRVEMCDCGIPSEEMDELWKRHPETRFVWSVQVGACRLRTDAESFMPYHFGYDGIRKLRDVHTAELKYCVDLICMDLGHMDISDYSFLSYMPKMKYLILADTPGTDFSVLAELKELVFLEIFLTEFDQAEVLTGLTKLEDLNIGNSRVDNIAPLLEMTWLHRLWLPGTDLVSHEERWQLRLGLPDTVVMFACDGSTGEGWRESPNYYDMRDLLGMDYAPGW